jgi:hypothetical protein
MTIWNKVILVLFVGILLTGCMEPPKAATHIGKSSDQYMMTKMVKYVKWGTSNPDIIKNEVYISDKKGHTDFSIREAINDYKNMFNSASEKMTKDYVSAVKERHNIVKIYKNSVNNALSKSTPRSFSIERGYDKILYNLDPALIEYNKEGNIISVMLQKHKISLLTLGKSKSYLHYRYTEIITGKSAQRLEYSIGNNVLNNGFIKEL